MQIVLGLLTAADGEPLAVRVFEGNTADPSTVGEQIRLLKDQFGVDEVVFVGDWGMIKSKGKADLSAEGLKYITALTNSQIRALLKQGTLMASEWGNGCEFTITCEPRCVNKETDTSTRPQDVWIVKA